MKTRLIEEIIAKLTVISLDALRDHKPIAVTTAQQALDLLDERAERIKELEAAQRWIPVSDELPPALGKSEEQIIKYEGALNKAVDAWFAARPSIERSLDFERVFEGGFRMAYDQLKEAHADIQKEAYRFRDALVIAHEKHHKNMPFDYYVAGLLGEDSI